MCSDGKEKNLSLKLEQSIHLFYTRAKTEKETQQVLRVKQQMVSRWKVS